MGTSLRSGRETIDEVFQLFILENGGPPRPPISTEFSLSVEIFDDTIHGRQRETSEATAPSRRRSCPLSSLPAAISFNLAVAPFFVCLVLTWQRRGFRVRSTAAVASTSLPAVRDRSVGVKRGQNPNIGVEAAVSKRWGKKSTNPKHWGFLDYYPFVLLPGASLLVLFHVLLLASFCFCY